MPAAGKLLQCIPYNSCFVIFVIFSAVTNICTRQTRGEHFEGVGGPEDKLARQARDFGGNNEFDAAATRGREVGSTSATDTTTAYGRNGDAMAEGREAVQSNIEGTKYNPRKEHFKGSDYYTPESVPGSISAEGYEPPSSVTESSREAERYE